MSEKGLDERARERARIIAERGQTLRVGERRPFDPLHRHHFAGRAVPVDRRRPDIPIVLGVLSEFRRCRGFEPKIHFHPHRAGQRLDHLDETKAAHFRRHAFGEPRGEEHVRQITREATLDAGAQDFHRDGLSACVRPDGRAVNLGDRSGGDRFAEALE